ncbi:hypothetical protein D3C71_2126150 [compost metagenome]
MDVGFFEEDLERQAGGRRKEPFRVQVFLWPSGLQCRHQHTVDHAGWPADVEMRAEWLIVGDPG